MIDTKILQKVEEILEDYACNQDEYDVHKCAAEIAELFEPKPNLKMAAR